MKAFIRLGQYFNPINPPKGSVILSFDNKTSKLEVISKSKVKTEIATKQDISKTAPTKLSQLENDTKFITLDDIDLTDIKNQLKEYTDSKVSRIFTYKGTISSIEQLPESSNIGDVYSIGNSEYIKVDQGWQELGPLFDLSGYVTVSYVNQELAKKADNSAVYSKDEADSKFLTEHQDISGKVDKEEGKSLIAISEIQRLSQISNYDDTEVKEELSTKAPLSSVYSKDEADQKFLTEHQDISGKVDKEEGKSLIADSEIERLAQVTNYDDTEIKEELFTKASLSSVYSKTDADQKFLTEHQDISGKVDKEEGKSLIANSEIQRLAQVTNYDDTEVKELIETKANSNDVYSKIEADQKFLVQHQDISGKVDKEEGKSLIADSEIERLAQVTNYDDTEVKADLATKAPLSSVYSKDEANQKFLVQHQDISGKVDKEEGKSLIANSEIERLSQVSNYDDTEVKADLATKAPLSSVYSKDEADQKFLTEHQSLSAYLTTSEVTTAINLAKSELQQQFAGAFHFKGQLNDISELNQLENVKQGDVYQIDDAEYAYNGTQFVKLGFNIDLSSKVDKEEGKSLIADTEIIRLASVNNYDDTEVKADLATKAPLSSVYSKADADQKFLTEHQDISGKVDKEEGKSLISDSEIERLSQVTNYDDTEVKEELSTKASLSSVYSKDEADQKFLTEHQSLSAYYTKDEIDQKNKTLIDVDEKQLGININNNSINLGSKQAISPTPAGDVLQVNIGLQNQTSGLLAFAHGKKNKALNRYAVAFGYQTIADGQVSHAEGMQSEAHGNYSHAEGNHPIAYAQHSHAQGYATNTFGKESHAQGYQTIVSGRASHVEGYGVVVSADFAHGEGYYSHVNAIYAHAEGTSTAANGQSSHAQGWASRSQGIYSHAEGKNTAAFGEASHTEGSNTITRQYASHAEGIHTEAVEEGQHVEGKYNIPTSGYQHIVGSGDENGSKNIQTLDWNGNEWNAGTITAADFITQNDKLSEKANTTIVSEINNKVSINAAQLGAISLRLSVVEDKVNALKKTNTEVIAISSDQTVTINNATTDYIIAGQMTKNISAIAKTLEVKNTDINIPASTTFGATSGNALLLNVKDQVEIKQSNVQMNYSQSSNCIKVINANTLIIKDTTFTGNTYNTLMTGQNCTSGFLKYMLIDNCNFDQTASHVNIWFAGHEDNAILTISNCHFKSAQQFLYLGDFSNPNNNLIVNIINCTIDNYDNNYHNKYGHDYSGIILIESRNIGTYEQLVTANPYGNGKVIFNIDNLIVKGTKITKDNFKIGTGDSEQMLYYYHMQSGGTLGTGGSGCIPFNQETKNLFPIFNIK